MSALSALSKAEGRFSADTAAKPVEARIAADGQAGHCRRPAAEGCRCPPTGAKGDRTPNMVSCPLLTPLTFLGTRLPSVARLKARGPQGRLVLQGTTLDGSEAFRSRTLPPCTVWPRTVMRGKPRKLTSGTESVPKANRRTEPSPRNPRFAAHLRCVSAKEGFGESRGGKGTIRCPCPLLPLAVGTAFPPVNTGTPRAAGRRPLFAS